MYCRQKIRRIFSVSGGNVWLTHDIPPDSKIIQQRSTTPRLNERLLDNSAQ